MEYFRILGLSLLVFFALVGFIAFSLIVVRVVGKTGADYDYEEDDELLPYDWEDPEKRAQYKKYKRGY